MLLTRYQVVQTASPEYKTFLYRSRSNITHYDTKVMLPPESSAKVKKLETSLTRLQDMKQNSPNLRWAPGNRYFLPTFT